MALVTSGDFVDQRGQRDRLPGPHCLAAVQRSHLQDVPNQFSQSICLFLQYLSITFGLLWPASHLQQVSIQLYVGHRRAQFVGHVGHEPASGPLQLFGPADVVVAGDVACQTAFGVAHGSSSQCSVIAAAILASVDYFSLPGFTPGPGGLQGLPIQFGHFTSHQRAYLLSQGFFRRVAGQGGESIVDVLNSHVQIHHGNGIAHAAQDRLALFLLGANLGRAGRHLCLQPFHQPGVLDGDGCLVGKGGDQTDMFLAKVTQLNAVYSQHADHPVTDDQGYTQPGTDVVVRRFTEGSMGHPCVG